MTTTSKKAVLIIIDGLDPERTYLKSQFHVFQESAPVKIGLGQSHSKTQGIKIKLILSGVRLIGNYLQGYPKFTQSTNKCIGLEYLLESLL